MDKKTLLSCWDREEWIFRTGHAVGKEVITSIPYLDMKHGISVRFCHYREDQVCNLLEVTFMKQLRSELPDIVKKACIVADERKSWHIEPENFREVQFDKHNLKSFFVLEFDGGYAPSREQMRYLIYVGFDKELNLTGQFIKKSFYFD